jgi:glycine cleavage system H protein
MDFDLTTLPTDLLYAPEEDMWLRFAPDGNAVIGATHLVCAHGQFMFFAPRPIGTNVARQRSLGVMETAKTAIAIHAPLSCTIVAANAAVEKDASLIVRDPYGAAWLFRIQPTALAAEKALLLDADRYREWLVPRLNRFEPPVDDADRSNFGRFY